MQNKISISVIIPVYNGEPYINKCFELLIKQDFAEPYEIIIVDDASTDNSRNLIKKYNSIDSCFRRAEHFVNISYNALNIFNPSKEKTILQNLTSFSLERSF